MVHIRESRNLNRYGLRGILVAESYLNRSGAGMTKGPRDSPGPFVMYFSKRLHKGRARPSLRSHLLHVSSSMPSSWRYHRSRR